MTTAKFAIDPLWRYLCPAWTSTPIQRASRCFTPPKRAAIQCLRIPRSAQPKSDAVARYQASRARDDGRVDAIMNPLYDPPPQVVEAPKQKKARSKPPSPQDIDFRQESTESLYSRLRILAIDGKIHECREIVGILVKERNEKPNSQVYNALILSNVSHSEGTAWRVGQLLDGMNDDGLQPDVQTCHAALKVLSVHVDHLLRTDILEYMNTRWIPVSDDGMHDVAAGLLREGLFEQALERLDMMRGNGVRIHGWLLDMAVYVLCEANEISEAYRIMRQRVDSGELRLSRNLWSFFLDKASEARHHAGTALAWYGQVNQKYVNPSSGMCLNVLASAARAADAVMATEVFTHLSKRGTTFQPIHYELLMSTYLAAQPPDLQRAMAILTIMALEKIEPSPTDTRPLYLYLRDKPASVQEALAICRQLHSQERQIPIAALNLLIECCVVQGNLSEALKIYKQIHTFVPISEGAKKTFANIETFNLLLKGCRVVDPPDAEQASFLVSELLALRIKPTPLTYDRLVLVFTHAGQHAITQSVNSPDLQSRSAARNKGVELVDWAFRHFADMQALEWHPRFGTIEKLAIELARLGDARCWDVLQAGEDQASDVASWDRKGHWVKKNVEEVWEMALADKDEKNGAVMEENRSEVPHLAEQNVRREGEDSVRV